MPQGHGGARGHHYTKEGGLPAGQGGACSWGSIGCLTLNAFDSDDVTYPDVSSPSLAATWIPPRMTSGQGWAPRGERQ